MKLTIHRGTHQIGGSCVELQSGDTRILVDAGTPLPKPGEKTDYFRLTRDERFARGLLLKTVAGLYKWDQTNPFNAILISHSHQDHYGQLYDVNSNIPIYVSAGALALIKAAFYFKGKDFPFTTNILQDKKPIDIKEFKITPYPADHSGFAALSFLIEAEGEKVFYSGDFRAHGKKKWCYENMIKNPPKDIDCLIMEGTSINREDENCLIEIEVRNKLEDIFKKANNLIFFACSTTNIDRICALYSACRRAGKTLVIDPYTAYILSSIENIAKNIPQPFWRNIRVLFAPDTNTTRLIGDKKYLKFYKSKISYKEIQDKKDKFVIKTSSAIRLGFAGKNLIGGATLIYSMYRRYLDNKEKNFWDKYGITPQYLHTSGHADIATLRQFADVLNPKKIIPIHTDHPEEFRKYFGNKVLDVQDGEVIEI